MTGPSPSRWQRVLQQCAHQLEGRWPERPAAAKAAPGLQARFLFSGQSHETVPRRLLLDKRLTPLERNAWQVFRLLLDGQGLATPRYEDLQPYLSTVPYGTSASRETIARVLTLLRLTRWLSLVARGRDPNTGRLLGALYVLHDEPLTPAEALELDQEYLELVAHSLSHAAKAVRIVAGHVIEDVWQDSNIDRRYLPTRFDTWAERWAQRGLDGTCNETEHHESELGATHPVRIRAASRSDSEPGLNARHDGAVRNPNGGACTVLKESISTVPRATPSVDNPVLRWPRALHLSPQEQHVVCIALNKLEPSNRQVVLDEAGARCTAGGIRKPGAYLMGLIQRALQGEFHPWAVNQGPSISASPPQHAPPTATTHPGQPLSPQAQLCRDELRRRCGKRSAH